VARTAFAGWQLGGIMTLSGGQPFTVLMSGDPNSVGGNTRPNLTGDPNQGPRTPIAWFNTGAFAAPAAQTFGTAGRNIVTLPPYKNLDFSASKSFRLGESRRIQLRAEFFNVLNHPNFCSEGNVPGNSFGTGTFGTINRATEPRDIQFGLKYIF
jgi:hypothetical protein